MKRLLGSAALFLLIGLSPLSRDAEAARSRSAMMMCTSPLKAYIEEFLGKLSLDIAPPGSPVPVTKEMAQGHFNAFLSKNGFNPLPIVHTGDQRDPSPNYASRRIGYSIDNPKGLLTADDLIEMAGSQISFMQNGVEKPFLKVQKRVRGPNDIVLEGIFTDFETALTVVVDFQNLNANLVYPSCYYGNEFEAAKREYEQALAGNSSTATATASATAVVQALAPIRSSLEEDSEFVPFYSNPAARFQVSKKNRECYVDEDTAIRQLELDIELESRIMCTTKILKGVLKARPVPGSTDSLLTKYEFCDGDYHYLVPTRSSYTVEFLGDRVPEAVPQTFGPDLYLARYTGEVQCVFKDVERRKILNPDGKCPRLPRD